MENKGKAISVIKIIWNVIEKLIIAAIVIISLIIVTQKMTNNDKAFLGYRIFRVQTGSMIPKYNIGDVILVKEKAIDKIVEGDDVTYWGTSGVMNGKIVTHQVIKVEEVDGQKVFHTKGIANFSEDPLVYGEQINGVVKGKLCIMTWICSILTNQYGFYFLGVIPMTIIIFLAFVKSNFKKIENINK